MSIHKIAFQGIVPLEVITEKSSNGQLNTLIRTASLTSDKIIIEANSEKAKIIEAEMKKHPRALFFRAKAIKADEANSNGDYFSEEEILKSYKTFEGVPFFTNHDNQDVEKARGKIIFAEWVPNEKAVYTISFIDRDAYPHICRSIEEEYVTGVSMGAIYANALIATTYGETKPVSEIKVGDKVISAFGNSCEVEKVYSSILNKTMYEFKLIGHKKAPWLTDDHPVYIIPASQVEQDGKTPETYTPEFRHAVFCEKGDYVLVPQFFSVSTSSSEKDIDKAFIYVDENKHTYFACPIKKIVPHKYSELCYDLKVKDDESYIANGIAVHNCSVEVSECNICGNVAESTESFCGHIKNRKGRKFTGNAKNVKTGEIKAFKDQLVFEYNRGIKFIELSAVVDPACPSCRIQGIIPCNKQIEDSLAKAARMENDLFMVKEAAIEKDASKEEIDQVEKAIQTLEDISINLIKNRKQVEVQFASELVEILANLQDWLDELVGAGYANLQGQEVPGTVGDVPAEEPLPADVKPSELMPTGGSPVSAGTPNAAPTSVAAEQPNVGTMSGNPSKAPVTGPSLPISSPIRPKASMGDMYNNIIKTANEFSNKLKKTSCIEGEDNMAKRRTAFEKTVQKQATKDILNESWQEKQQFTEYIKEMPSLQSGNYKLSIKKNKDTFIIVAENKDNKKTETWIYEDLNEQDKEIIKSSPTEASNKMLQSFITNQKKQEGVNKMSDKKQEKLAGANSVNTNTDVITEKQLDEKALYHARTGTDIEEISEKQLEALRKGQTSDVITEKQLDEAKMHPRAETPEVVTQSQLDDVRENEEKDEVTQKQLNVKRTNKEQDVVTEKQLSETDAPWARTAKRDASLFRTASDHLNAVVDVFADTAIETGSTPDELQVVAQSLTASTKARYDLAKAMLDAPQAVETISFAKRASYWANKNIKVATSSLEDTTNAIINKLRVVASDTTMNPDVIIEAMDVIAEDGAVALNTRIDEKIKSASVKVEKASVKNELREALKQMSSTKETRDAKRQAVMAKLDSKQTRVAEREEWETALNSNKIIASKEQLGNATDIIETTFTESGLDKKSASLKKDIVSFAKGALSAKNMRMASITNVTISGDTIQIAVQTDSGTESVNIPIGEKTGPKAEEVVPEGDLSGEGMGDTLPAISSPTTETAPAPTSPTMAKNKKTVKLAQTPSGAGIPNSPGGVSAPGGDAGMQGGAPAGQEPVQALMTGEPETADEEIPTVGEKQMPWTICPECGSSDVDVENDEKGNITGTCKNADCGCKYEAMVKKEIEFKILNPVKDDKANAAPEAPEAPEVPALPVAASIRMDKGSIKRIAKNLKEHGHVCPSCGNQHCPVTAEKNGRKECQCGQCDTKFAKDMLVDKENTKNAYMTVEWDVTPDMNCPDCAKKALAFASKIKVEGMLRTAAKNGDSFPMANCVERMAKEYGGDTVGSFGPCKGKTIANCICKQLKSAGLSKVRHMQRLAAVSLQEDPIDDCIKDQMKKSYTKVEASKICGCIKTLHASDDADNIWVQAFTEDIQNGKEKVLKEQDLVTLAALLETKKVTAKVIEEDIDLAEPLPEEELGEIEVDVDEVADVADDADVVDEECECKKEITCPSCGEEICTTCQKCVGEECQGDKCDCSIEVEVCDEDVTDDAGAEPVNEDVSFGINNKEKDMTNEEIDQVALAMSGSKVRRSGESKITIAGKPTKVEDIEGNVEAGVPRSEQYLGNEKGADSLINKKLNKPNVPRGDAYMGKEKEADSLINKNLELPDVKVDSSYMGGEKEIQKNMPAINNDIKGTVIASDKTKKVAKKLKEVETVEKDADVPRGKATMGNEGKDNIDVPLNKPDVPRGKATMGNESADNIDVKLNELDVPMGDAYMGKEKETVGKPANNDEYLKNVQQSREIQMERIANARREKARDTAAWLKANNRIAGDREAFDNVVKALCSFEIDKIETIAEAMFPMKKTASEKTESFSLPLGMTPDTKSKSLKDELEDTFTIGNTKFDRGLTEIGER